jgi:hypothetical protein
LLIASLSYPGFKPDKEKINSIAKRLEMLELGPDDNLVLDLLSNLAYMGTDDNRLPTPALRAGDGSYHIQGSLTTAPLMTLKKLLEACGSIVSIIGSCSVLLVVPIPRCVVGKCCTDPAHIENVENWITKTTCWMHRSSKEGFCLDGELQTT